MPTNKKKPDLLEDVSLLEHKDRLRVLKKLDNVDLKTVTRNAALVEKNMKQKGASDGRKKPFGEQGSLELLSALGAWITKTEKARGRKIFIS